MNHYTPPKQNSLKKTKCYSCHKEYTQSMMMEVKIYLDIRIFKTHLCIKCYNLTEKNL
jgi:hypothetical protein